MSLRTDPKAKPSRLSGEWRIAIGVLLLIVVIGLVVYFNRNRSHPHTDPNIGKATDVVIEGTVSCNGELVAGGYVIAWQGGPPVAHCDVRSDGAYRMVNAPLGKCIITYAATPPRTIAPRHNLQEVDPALNDPRNMPKKGGPSDKKKGADGPKSKAKEPKDGGAGPKQKDPSGQGKGGEPKDSGFPFGGSGIGRESPVGIQKLTPEQKKVVETAAAKYSDPSSKPFELETKKGTNTLNLSLTTP